MPLYEYHCQACDTHFEHIRPIKEADQPAPCPQCAATTMRQLSCFSVKKSSSSVTVQETPATRRAHMGGCGCCH